MAIAKVILNGETQMDVTQKTVTAGSMLSGTTALKNDGTDITGNIASKTSSDMTVSGATVTAPAGYYASAASKSVASGSTGTPTASKGTVSNHSVSVTPSVTNTTGYITGGTKTGTSVTVSASELVSGTKTISASGTTDVTNYESVSVPSGSAKTPATTITANPTVSVSSSGLITASVSKTQSVTPTVSAGYVASGTAGTITVSGSGTSQLTTQAAQTIHPSTTDQTIASGKYLTGVQTVKAVTTTNLTAENIVSGVTVKVGDSTDDDCVASVTGTAETGGDDFIIAIKLSTSSGNYEPYECTFETALAAYNAGKHIAFVLEQSTGNPIPCAGAYYPSYNAFGYGIRIDTSGSNWTGVGEEKYMWTSAGVTRVATADYYSTSNATATPADVASGKVFYNASGYQVGTASGGGGGGGGLVTGTLTVETTVQTSTNVKITDTTALGFTPTKFLLLKDTDTKTNATIYAATYTEQAGVGIRTKSVYDGQGGYVSVSGVGSSWTSATTGYLRLSAGEIYVKTSSSNKLEAGTYTWYAIQ